MINPINLIKIDEIADTSEKIFHIDELPECDQEDYDLSNTKDFEKFIKDVKSEVRNSFEYRELIKYLRNYGGMDRSGISPRISNTDSSHIKIEVHHTPFVLEDIVRIVYEKRLQNHEDLSLQMVAKEVMECHYKCIVGLYPLTSTEHELVHNGYLFIPPSGVFGQYKKFVEDYDKYIDPDDKQTIAEIEEHEKTFNPEEQNKILSQSNIYLDTQKVYDAPSFNQFEQGVSQRINDIRNNMYMLPVLNEKNNTGPKPVIVFLNDKGEEIDG